MPLGVKVTPPPGSFGPPPPRMPPPGETPAQKKIRYAELCRRFVMPPLDELEHSTLTIISTSIGRNVEEPASEKRAMRAELRAKSKAIKLAALGLGPVPRGGMPKFGPTLYWNKELAFKMEVCGSLTAAETAKAKELGNKTTAMLHKRARDKRKSRLKKIAAVAAVAVGAVFLGPMVAGALKGGGAAAAAGAGKVKAAAVLAKGATAAKVAKGAAVGAKILTASKAAAVVAPLAKGAAKQAATVAAEGASIATQAQELIPKVVKVANNVRTIDAIAHGEVPPPPISIEGSNFTEYASSIGRQLLEKEIAKNQERLSQAQFAADQREIEAEIMRLQRQVPRGVPQYPVNQLAPEVQASMAHERTDWLKIAALAVPVVLVISGRA